MDTESLVPLSFELPPDDEPHQPSERPPDKPYHSKRPHKKSRTGCKNCKARKVKCDEARPVCRSCRLRKAECVYPSQPSSSSASSATAAATSLPSPGASSTADTVWSPSAESTATATSTDLFSPSRQAGSDGVLLVAEPMYRPPRIDNIDMKLLWFYTTATASSFAVDAGGPTPVDDILRVRMVQFAFETPFLMDSLFALSCLHLQSLDQDCDQNRALAYRARSFEGYRKAVEEAKPETFPALIANSLFLTALSSQVFREDESKELYIIDWMVVWRGIGLIIELMGVQNLFTSGVAELFYRPPIDLDKSAASIPNHLLFMISSIKPGDIDYPDVQTYYETLKYLGSLYQGLREGFGAVLNLRIITWFTFVPKPFIQIARERRPRALIIIAHYVAFIKMVTSVWWLEGIGDRSIDDITKYLDAQWQYMLVIPQLAREVQSELAVARILLEDPEWVPPATTNVWWTSVAPLAWVDDVGRRVRWKEDEKKLVIMDPKSPGDLPSWNK